MDPPGFMITKPARVPGGPMLCTFLFCLFWCGLVVGRGYYLLRDRLGRRGLGMLALLFVLWGGALCVAVYYPFDLQARFLDDLYPGLTAGTHTFYYQLPE